MITMTKLTQLQIEDPDNMKHFKNQLNKLETEIAHTNFAENSEARQEFLELIMQFREENMQHFSSETWKSIDQDLHNFMEHHENQIAQGIVQTLRGDVQ